MPALFAELVTNAIRGAVAKKLGTSLNPEFDPTKPDKAPPFKTPSAIAWAFAPQEAAEISRINREWMLDPIKAEQERQKFLKQLKDVQESQVSGAKYAIERALDYMGLPKTSENIEKVFGLVGTKAFTSGVQPKEISSATEEAEYIRAGGPTKAGRMRASEETVKAELADERVKLIDTLKNILRTKTGFERQIAINELARAENLAPLEIDLAIKRAEADIKHEPLRASTEEAELRRRQAEGNLGAHRFGVALDVDKANENLIRSIGEMSKRRELFDLMTLPANFLVMEFVPQLTEAGDVTKVTNPAYMNSIERLKSYQNMLSSMQPQQNTNVWRFTTNPPAKYPNQVVTPFGSVINLR